HHERPLHHHTGEGYTATPVLRSVLDTGSPAAFGNMPFGTRRIQCCFFAAAAAAAILPAYAQQQDHLRHEESQQQQQRLGVVVPIYDGDLARTVRSLERWPTKCSPLTLQNAGLVLYAYTAEEPHGAAALSALDSISDTGGRCFSGTRIVYANLAEQEDDIYPEGPSVMFYNMFLDENVRFSLSEYDALSIIEPDVLVASDDSFEELYHAAFRVNEEFWVKGSNLEGTSFPSSAEASEMWQAHGHINGNAIYNNDDPAFVEYVEYTRARWGYEHPYDVALWLTISDFPYSWPLYQRYSSKFVVTNLISYVGYEHVGHDTVSDAVAGQTLFIHGSSVEEGNVASFRAVAAVAEPEAAQQRSRKLTSEPKWKTAEKWRNGNDDGTPKWQRNQKWKNSKDDGSEPKWRTNQKWKNRNDSSDDSSSSDTGCSSRCAYTSKDGTRGRVCDPNCSSPNVYGTKGCAAKGGIYGDDCRVCYNDVDRALKQDSPDNRAIMCSTVKPVEVYARRMSAADESEPSRVARSLEALKEDASSPSEEVESAMEVNQDRKLTSEPKWKTQQKWKTANDDGVPKWQRNQKWKNNKDDGSEPKWRTNQKWKNRNDSSDDTSSDAGCSSRCAYTSKDGTRGRVCDPNCSSPNVYGTKGCAAKGGIYGEDCRVCYNDVDRALKQDSPDNRAIMCSTVKPVEVYARRMSATAESEPSRVARNLEALQKDVSSPSEEVESPMKGNQDRKLTSEPKWKTQQKWKTANDDGVPKWQRNQKWKNNKDDGSEPKWRTNQKWKNRNDSSDDSSSPDTGCSSRCAYTSKDGTRGRVCDPNCSSPNVYGTKG
ncbi:unnamed protein product, partial [Ectocarpus fasciculatus]